MNYGSGGPPKNELRPLCRHELFIRPPRPARAQRTRPHLVHEPDAELIASLHEPRDLRSKIGRLILGCVESDFCGIVCSPTSFVDLICKRSDLSFATLHLRTLRPTRRSPDLLRRRCGLLGWDLPLRGPGAQPASSGRAEISTPTSIVFRRPFLEIMTVERGFLDSFGSLGSCR